MIMLKVPSITTMSTAKQAREQIQTILGTDPDGIQIGRHDLAAIDRLNAAPDASDWPPAAASAPGGVLNGDGTWPWTARIDGDDIVVDNCRATCFGGSNDPQDNGETASGISTKNNPDLAAVSLPMDFGDRVPNTKGSPIPKVPWKTVVMVTANGASHHWPVIDIGPAKRTGNALDLTLAAAKLFNPHATASNFEVQCSYRIIGGAKFVNA